MRQKSERVESRKKNDLPRKEWKSLREDFEVGRFTAQKGLWNIAKKKKRMLEDRGALPKEENEST